MRADLDAETRRAIEFDAVLDWLASRAATGPGVETVRGLIPSRDPIWIEREHRRVGEALRHLETVGRLVAGGLPDPGAAFAVLPVEGARLDAAAAGAIGQFLLAGGDLRRRLAALDPEAFPLLREMAANMPDLDREARPMARGVLPDGRLADDASPELARIRASIARLGERLRRMLESLVRDPGSDAVIRDEFVTQRNGRYVVPVRSDAPRRMQGIVHASSSSGATLFVEPLESVELNNELVRLAEAEIEEQERVLLGWTARLRLRIHDARAAVGGLADVDGLQARALFAREAGAVRPEVVAGGRLDLGEARHPLLDRRLRETGQRAVPASLRMEADERVLVISGPNAGGKTVALKTLGLACVMAQAGIPVAAERAVLPLFAQIRADIGDHQSIEADLSTFSAHVRAVDRFLRELDPPLLCLFDEIGTGTDPMEGAALARAVLESLLQEGCTTVATTHQGSLKAWAFATPGAASAALEFDTDALRPTYRILMGAAGVSAGLEVAARLGLQPHLVERARELLGSGGLETERTLNRLRELTADAEARRARLAAREAELAEERARLDRRAVADAENARRDRTRALEEALLEFRDEARREVARLRDSGERMRLERELARADRRLQAEARRRAEPPPAGVNEGAAAGAQLADPAPGCRVLVYSLGRVGEVVAVRGAHAEVRLGSTVFTVALADLRGAPAAEPAERPPQRWAPQPDPAGPSAGAATEVVLIGMRVEEALAEVDKRLDDAVRRGETELRIVHGHGTGRLRSAVRRFLSGHPHVDGHRPGAPYEGGDGATVAHLR
jgi:DNA mismatch repair protein MutS2